MYWFTSDEHYHHKNIITYCNRPFKDVDEMDETLISNHNSVVKEDDITIHCGDFTLAKSQFAKNIILRLKGDHIFLTGSHDKWMEKINPFLKITLPGYVLEQKINDTYIVACHYAFRVWPRSHYNSINVHGHSHGELQPIGRQLDVGVDSHNYFPISLTQVIQTINLNQGVSNDQASSSPRV